LLTTKKRLLVSAASLAAGVSMLFSAGGVATAATVSTFPNSSYGFDGNANLIVGGGSTTVYKIAQGFADLYNSTASCSTNNASYNPTEGSPAAYPQTSPAFNQCDPTSQTYSGVDAGGNYDGDTVAIAASVGSSTGIASLNGDHAGAAGTYAYEGTNADIPTTGDPNAQNGLSNGYGTVNFGLSSRAAKTSGGNCNTPNPTTGAAGDELQCDTFWGVAADGVQVFSWGSTVGTSSDTTQLANSNLAPSTGVQGLTAADLDNIWECKYTTWGQIPGYTPNASTPPADAPIVPWSMNSNSGTYADFNNFVTANDGQTTAFTMDDHVAEYSATNPGGSASSPTPPTGACARELTGANPLPLENDIKPLLTDVENNQGGLNQNPLSTNNPANWIWAGSNGLLSAYTYLSQPSLFGNQYNTNAIPVTTGTGNGQVPTTTNVGNGSYPIPRILSLVTTKADADCPIKAGVCNLTMGAPVNANGTTDANVLGPTSGAGGAVREFVRFVCRDKAETTFTANGEVQSSPTDPYTGVSDLTEISNVLSASGFTLPPTADRTPGSDCDVQSIG
jgi:ABC-type phosphate transport system substrate-binding protein